jgi:hypothetical protein
MIASNARAEGKFSIGRHARRQLHIGRHHALRQAGSISITLGDNIGPDHWHNVDASAIDKRPATTELGLQKRAAEVPTDRFSYNPHSE